MSYTYSDPIRTYSNGATAQQYRKGKAGKKVHTCITRHDPRVTTGIWEGYTYCASNGHSVWLRTDGGITTVQGKYFPDHASAEKFLLAAYEGLIP